MNASILEDAFRQIIASLNPAAVSQYLAVTDPWHLESRQDHVREVWALPDGDGLRRRILLPLAPDYVDFNDRFYDALVTLCRINGWDAYELSDRITTIRADLLYIRLDANDSTEGVPIQHAE